MAKQKHAFQAIQMERDGTSEAVLNVYRVTAKGPASAAYAAAEALCEAARKLPHAPAAFVREVGEA